ncbi:hypothetical protein QUA30_16185 [Microcoleus sp. Pol14C2]|uniref:hypothetical protein n=1 Tax=unclassified Microcoleus TaxID=2642155 RepID=UPI002FD43A98
MLDSRAIAPINISPGRTGGQQPGFWPRRRHAAIEPGQKPGFFDFARVVSNRVFGPEGA